MTEVATMEPKALVALVETTPVVVLQDAETYSRFYEEIRRETDAFVPDLTTSKGRDEIKSMAFKVTKTKTAIDGARKLLIEDAKKTVDTVNAAGRKIWDELEALAKEVRRPLTEWEEAEKQRQKDCDEAVDKMIAMGVITVDDTSETVSARLDAVLKIEPDEDVFQDRYSHAIEHRERTIGNLQAAHERLLKEEADRAELERLREAERIRLEREAEERAAADARAAKERAEQQRKEAAAHAEREATEAKERAERAEADRIAAAAREAEERARREAEEAHQRELAAEREKSAQAEREAREREEASQREAKAAQDRAEAVERQAREEREARERAAEQEAEARRKREADTAHRSAIMSAAKEALMEHAEIDEATAKRVVLAITGKHIPRVTLEF